MKVRRAETPFYRRLKGLALALRSARLPLPGFLLAVVRLIFLSYHGAFVVSNRLLSFFIREPMFRSRCVTFGKRVLVSRMPFIVGQPKIHIGDGVNFFGKVDVFSSRLLDEPTLILKDRVDIGHAVVFVVNREIVIEEDVNVASGVVFMDTDSHPRDTAARIADQPPPLDEIKPVRICKYSWIGQRSFILKGVTVGEGAVVGANSVVVTDVPAYTVVMGNPARVVVKGLTPPPGSAYAKAPAAAAEEPGATAGS